MEKKEGNFNGKWNRIENKNGKIAMFLDIVQKNKKKDIIKRLVVTYETPCGTLIRMRPPGVWIFKAVPGYTFGGHWTDISEWPGGADMMCY